MLRYSAGVGNTHSDVQWKLCRPGEIAAAVAAGMDFIANSEWYESRVTEGAAAGRADGSADLAFWKSRGLHRGAAIYVSWDAAPVRAKWPQVDAYLAAYKTALSGYYVVGAYAGTPYLRHALNAGVIRFGWRPNAGSWSDDGLPYQPAHQGRHNLAQAQGATPAAIWQTGNYWYGKDADENLILRTPCGSHLQAAQAPAPAPTSAPAPHRVNGRRLRRRWPSWVVPHGEYFGLITGPPQSHGGINAAERRQVRAIQVRLVTLRMVPGVDDVHSGWCDAKFEEPTEVAVARWQHAHMPDTQFYGQVWPDDWTQLFTY
jgi:hypothetical protein